MRILRVNSVVDDIQPASGEVWSSVFAGKWKGHLVGETSENIIDYDVYVIDLDRITDTAQGASGRSISAEILERVSAGGCLICFAGTKALGWLPGSFLPRGGGGNRTKIENQDPALAAFFERFKDDITYKTQFEPASWTPLVLAMNGYPVAASQSYGAGLIFVLPEFRNRASALRAMLDSVIPAKLPSLRADQPEAMDEAAPEWLDQYPVAGGRKLESEIASTQKEIAALLARVDDLEKRRRDLIELQGLLWYEGRPLELVVEKTLKLLGIEAAPRQPIDLACTLDDGGELYIEVEGTVGPIQLRKGQQLLSYIAGADDPAIVRGAIIGNPFRKESPKNRPPANSQAGLFSDPLKRLADQQKWKLVDTVKVFSWLKEHLTGKEKQASERARKALGIE